MAIRHVASSYIECTSNLPPVSGATLCMHFVRRADRGNWGGLIFLRNSGTGEYGGAFLYSDGDTVYEVSGSQQVTTGVTVSNDVPCFVACTYNGSGTNTGTIYVRNITTTSLTSTTFDINANLIGANQLWIGDNGFGNYLDGDTLNIIIYDRILTASELLRQSKQRVPISRKNLNRWYPCLNSSSISENMNDWSGNNRTATLVGSSTASLGNTGISWRQ